MNITSYRGYDIKPHKESPSCMIIVTSGKGGKIPDCLDGVFTSRAIAQNHIDKYLESKPMKEDKNAKAGTTSGD
jgi:hypothetical protein